MLRMTTIASTVLALFTVIACAGPGGDEDKIQKLESMWSQKFAEKDIDWIVAIHKTDGQQFPPNAPPIVGSDALRAAWQDMMDTEGLGLKWESSFVKVSASGDMAYDTGAGMITSADGTATPAKYLVVWEKIDGEWKVAVDMFSPNK